MKRTILLVMGAAGLALAGYCGTRLSAQTGTTAATPAAGTGTRVAVVNVGQVFSKYEKAKTFKSELEETLKPYKTEAEKLRKGVLYYQEQLEKKNFKDYTKEQFEQGILDHKRKLEDLDRNVRSVIGKKQEDQLVQLWKEVNTHIQAFAQANGIHLVMGYGDPLTPEEMTAFPNINRKMQGMDLGSVTPLFVGQGLDISGDVVRSLNDHYQRNGGAARPAAGASSNLAPKGN